MTQISESNITKTLTEVKIVENYFLSEILFLILLNEGP
jgi:hypothetical protein